MTGILVRFAGCCNPVPGDNIVGFISRGHGVTVHRSDCPNLRHAEADRLIEVSWLDDKGTSVYNAGIKVIGSAQAQVLAQVAAAVAELKLEIVSTNGRTDGKSGQVIIDFNIRLNNKEELDRLIKKLSQNPGITDVFRTAT